MRKYLRGILAGTLTTAILLTACNNSTSTTGKNKLYDSNAVLRVADHVWGADYISLPDELSADANSALQASGNIVLMRGTHITETADDGREDVVIRYDMTVGAFFI